MSGKEIKIVGLILNIPRGILTSAMQVHKHDEIPDEKLMEIVMSNPDGSMTALFAEGFSHNDKSNCFQRLLEQILVPRI